MSDEKEPKGDGSKASPTKPTAVELLEQAAALLERRTERVKRSRSLAAEVRRLAEKAAAL